MDINTNDFKYISDINCEKDQDNYVLKIRIERNEPSDDKIYSHSYRIYDKQIRELLKSLAELLQPTVQDQILAELKHITKNLKENET